MTRYAPAACAALALALLPASTYAQNASEAATFTQVISGTEIEIEWSRPSLRGREVIFGRQVPWGEVWTPGANRATTIRFSKDVVLSGTPIPAGRYSVWLAVTEDEPWRLGLHADTTLFHSDHPPIAEAVVDVAVVRSRTADLQESLEWDLDHIRLDGAELVMHWGYDRVTVPLQVDPGIELATPVENARPLLGEWLFDDSGMLPPPEAMARFADPPGNPTLRFLEVLLAEERPRPIRIDYDEGRGLVLFVDALMTAGEAAFYSAEGDQPDVVYGQALLPRGPGFFMMAGTFGGEVSAVNPQFASIIEFEYDEGGRAVAFTIRDPEEEVLATGVRPGG